MVMALLLSSGVVVAARGYVEFGDIFMMKRKDDRPPTSPTRSKKRGTRGGKGNSKEMGKKERRRVSRCWRPIGRRHIESRNQGATQLKVRCIRGDEERLCGIWAEDKGRKKEDRTFSVGNPAAALVISKAEAACPGRHVAAISGSRGLVYVHAMA